MKKKLIIIGSICAVILVLIGFVTIARYERKPEGTYYCSDRPYMASYYEYTFYEDGTYFRKDNLSIIERGSAGRWVIKEGIIKLDGEDSDYFSIFQYHSSTDSFSDVQKRHFWHKKQ